MNEDETKARIPGKLSKNATANEASFSDNVKMGIASFLDVVRIYDAVFNMEFNREQMYPSLSSMHKRVLVKEMLAFFQVCTDDRKALQVSAEVQLGRAFPALSYFIAWVSMQVNETHELRRAVEALQRAMKDKRHHLPPDSFASLD